MTAAPKNTTTIPTIDALRTWLHQHGTGIKHLCTDTRKIIDPDLTVFFAIVAQKDGHAFILDAYAAGVRTFIISDAAFAGKQTDAQYLLVNDMVVALQWFARIKRDESSMKVIGITGSNGKTVVKEWLNQLLAPDYAIVRSPKSYNSQIGVALSVWEINSQHTLGIFEAGISQPNEMPALEAMIQPEIGILTNITGAHDEGFHSRTEKLQEKLQLFSKVEWLIYSPDYLQGLKVSELPGKKQFSWSPALQASLHAANTNPVDLQVVSNQLLHNKRLLTATYKGEEITCMVPFTDAASTENAIICWATLLCMGYAPELTAERIAGLAPLDMRLALKSGINHCALIDDSYSADIASLNIALDFLQQQNTDLQKTVILSDIPQTGRDVQELYTEVAALLKSKNVERMIGIGTAISTAKALFPKNASFYPNTEAFTAAYKSADFHNETILIKGARAFGFERISKLLSQKVHDTVLEIDLSAMVDNLNFYRSKLKPGVKVMAMVKAFAYGAGSFEIANLLQYHQVDYLAVAYADEGVALRNAGISMPIMVMSPEPSAFDLLIQYRLEPELYSLEILEAFAAAIQTGVKYPVHLKIDTGMHRLGFDGADLPGLAEALKELKNIKVISVFSHLAASDNAALLDFTDSQIERFSQAAELIEWVLRYPPLRHILNTAGVTTRPDAQMDMVRLGIGLYGYDAALQNNELRTVGTLKTTVTQVKELAAGETIGYNRTGQLTNKGTIATVKIGYADGYSRAFGNGVGHMRINGVEVPTIGSICMDMCMLDVTGLAVNAGDEVVVFDATLDIAQLAQQIHTIPYEILTNISQRVKRVYFYE